MSNLRLESNIICPECLCIPIIGFNFVYENINILEVCELYSYCIFNHKNKKTKTNKINFYNLNLDDFINMKYNFKEKCDLCKMKDIEYHCLDCKRNICSECFKYKKYLII